MTDYLWIRFVENPTEEQQLEAIRGNIYSLRFIANPTDNVIREAITTHPYSVKFLFDQNKANVPGFSAFPVRPPKIDDRWRALAMSLNPEVAVYMVDDDEIK